MMLMIVMMIDNGDEDAFHIYHICFEKNNSMFSK